MDGIHLLLVYDFCIDGSRADIGMSHELTGRIKVCPQGEHGRAECVAARMKRDVLVNFCVLAPFLDTHAKSGTGFRQLEIWLT